MEKLTVTHDQRHYRFEVALGGEIAYLEYRYYKKDIAFMHTFVPESFKGKGVATEMAVNALGFAIAENRKIMLYCQFMSRFVKEHPEYHYLVDTEYHPSFKR